MFRKFLVEIVRTLIARHEYLQAMQYLQRLTFKELPPSLSIYDTSELNMIKILKQNREIGLYFLIIASAINRLRKSGLESAEKLRVYDMEINGVLNRSIEYSFEIALGGRYDSSGKENQKLLQEAEKLEVYNNALREDLRSKALSIKTKANAVLQESSDIMVIEAAAGEVNL